MKKLSFIAILFLAFATQRATAQFAKPLPASHPTTQYAEANYNVGIFGGMSATRWLHTGGVHRPYEQPIFLFDPNAPIASLLDHGLAGIAVERKLGENNSIGIEAFYANRSTMLSYEYELPTAIGNNQMYFRQDSITYSEICAQIPLTQYFGNGNIKPYVFVAPRFTMPIAGNMHWTLQTLAADSTGTNTTIDTATIAMTRDNMRPWNIGAVVGAGVRFKVPINSYYLLLKLDASCYMGVFNTYSEKEIAGETQPSNVIGVSHIDPTLLGKRHIGNATVKLTVLFPLKKMGKGACVNWGEYD